MRAPIHRFAAAFVTLAVVLASLLGSCGLPTDEAPTIMAASDLPTGLTEVSTADRLTADLLTDSPIIYMVGQDNLLAEVRRNISRTPDAVMSSLLLGTFPHEQELGVKTAITRDTDYNSVEVPVGTRLAFVDLAEGSLRTTARGEKEIAYAQIVFSLTELPEVDGVVFMIDGEQVSVPTDLAATEPGDPVDRGHFDSLNPQPRIGFVNEEASDSPTPTPTVAEVTVGEGVEIPVWMVSNDDQIVRVWRTLERSPEAILANLFLGPRQDELDSGLRSTLGDAAEVATLDIDEQPGSVTAGTAFVDLAPASLPGAADDQQMLAIAQIVFSLTELREIESVIISVAGERLAVPTIEGLTEPGFALRRSDFEPGAPPAVESVVPNVGPTPTPTPAPDP